MLWIFRRNSAGRRAGICSAFLMCRTAAPREGNADMIYLQLFWSFFQIGLFSFGGGYAALPLIQGASPVKLMNGLPAFLDLAQKL